MKLHDQANLAVGDLIGMLVIAVLGYALYPTVQTFSNSSVAAAGGTGTAAGQFLALGPLFYAIVVTVGIIAYLFLKGRSHVG